MKLKYEKYKGLDNIITIDLHNGFSVIAISSFDKENNEYIVELHIKDNQISDWKLIEEAENLKFKACDRINSAILKQISKFLEEGFFDKYINRYEYETKCFDIGNDIMEKERLGDE
jgi:hypothetical protein